MITIQNRNKIIFDMIRDLEKLLETPKITKKLQSIYNQRIEVLDSFIVENLKKRT